MSTMEINMRVIEFNKREGEINSNLEYSLENIQEDHI